MRRPTSHLENEDFQRLCVVEVKRALLEHTPDLRESLRGIQRLIAKADLGQFMTPEAMQRWIVDQPPKMVTGLTAFWEVYATAEAKHGRPEHLAAVLAFRGGQLEPPGMALIAPLLRGELKKKGSGNYQHRRNVNHYAALEVPLAIKALKRYRPDVKFKRDFAIDITADVFNISRDGLRGYLKTHNYRGERHGRKKPKN